MESPEKCDESVDLVIDEDDFVIITDEDIKSNTHWNGPLQNITDTSEGMDFSKYGAPNQKMNKNDDEDLSQKNDESIEDQIIKVQKDFEHWTELRRDTISNLREIADYIGRYKNIIMYKWY